MGDTSRLLDGTPSARSQWASDVAVAVPGDTPVTFGSAPFTVEVSGTTPTGAQVLISSGMTTGAGTPHLQVTQQLSGEQSLVSSNQRYRAVAQSDGNLVVYARDGRVLWASGVHAPGARTTLQSDGNLVTYVGSRPVWNSRTWGNPGARLVMQDDGNLVLYRANGSAAWSTGWDTPDRLRPGQQLFAGQALVAPNGRYRAVAQADGNLVVYSAGGRVVWASSRYAAGARLVMQSDGNLVSYAPGGRATWSTNTWRFPGATAVLRDDGGLAVHHDGRAIWASPVDGQR
jgi:hypothetical protein